VKPNIGRAILGGFVGTVLLTLMTLFVAPMMAGQKMDMAAKLSEMMGTGLPIGIAMHFLIGSLVFPLIYSLVLFRFLPGAPWIKGVISGVIFWLGLEIVAMPMMGAGVFSSQMGGMKAAMAALIAHLVYGAALGGIAGPPAAIEAQATS
jgi:uncharacterized membrane protein YagU involved in acid resistance